MSAKTIKQIKNYKAFRESMSALLDLYAFFVSKIPLWTAETALLPVGDRFVPVGQAPCLMNFHAPLRANGS